MKLINGSKAGGNLKILIAVIIFSAIILFHEFGHFLFAKLNGIGVTEFSLGMGPRLFSFQKGETRYSLKLLPIGGSCAMVGEDTDEEDLPGSFNAASVGGRISVVAAGPVFNFILAFVLAVIIVGFVGYDPAEVVEVESGSPVAEAGLEKGDVITEYDGYHVDLAKDLYVYMYLNDLKEGDTVTMTVKRDGETRTITYTPDVSVRYLLGFNRSDASSMTVESLIDGMPLQEAGLQAGDTIFFIADKEDKAAFFAGQIRNELGTRLDLIEKNAYRFCYVNDFPMFERDPETKKIGFTHNPFSMPQGGLEALNTMDPLDILAYQYDIVCNGVELSSGAVRNHDMQIMVKAFEIAGYDEEVLKAKFGALYNAFQFGAPPHAGMAPGVDRMIMLLRNEENIREVIPFPMSGTAQDLMCGAPNEVTEQQLREVHIKVRD